MNLKRRDLIAGLGGLAATAAFGRLSGQPPAETASRAPEGSGKTTQTGFPRKKDFEIEEGYTYINAAYTHPIPKVSLEAAQQTAVARNALRPRAPRGEGAEAPRRANPKALFAQLINAKPSEIAYVSSTSAGENLVVQALELDRRFDGNVVTDGLHFDGAILHLLELKKRGLDVRIVEPNEEFRIDLKDMERLVDDGTRLIEISSVAMYNGFQHDLKAVSDLAHAHGAYVYADIVQSAGAELLDIEASGVDFAACSTFKWLMGDTGMGFLYAREAVLDKIQRPVSGYFQAARMEGFYPPNLPEGEYTPVGYDLNRSAAAMFETGTFGGGSVATALVAKSLEYVMELGVENIVAHRQPLIKRLQEEVPRFGFTPVTPPESTSGNVTFARKDVYQSDFPEKLTEAKVNVRFSRHWMRLSPSVYNDMNDIDRFLEAMS